MNQGLAQAAVITDVENLRYLSLELKNHKIAIKSCSNSLEEFLQRFPNEEVDQLIAE